MKSETAKRLLAIIFRDLEKRKVFINEHGVVSESEYDKNHKWVNKCIDNITRAVDECAELWTSCEKLNQSYGSYYMKHALEDIREDHEYISNGELMLAMLLNGFEIAKIMNSPNVYFKVKEVQELGPMRRAKRRTK